MSRHSPAPASAAALACSHFSFRELLGSQVGPLIPVSTGHHHRGGTECDTGQPQHPPTMTSAAAVSNIPRLRSCKDGSVRRSVTPRSRGSSHRARHSRFSFRSISVAVRAWHYPARMTGNGQREAVRAQLWGT